MIIFKLLLFQTTHNERETNVATTSKMPIYFYRERDPYGEFSNFYPCEFQICARDIFDQEEFESELIDKTITVHSSEQAIIWMKAVLMNDSKTALLIESSDSPGECNILGKEVTPFDDILWKMWREEIAIYVLTEKFASSDHLFSKLQSTKDKIIAEASAKDRIWGIGIGKKKAMMGVEWKGGNLLGRSLMTVRQNLDIWNLLVLGLSDDLYHLDCRMNDTKFVLNYK